MDDEARTFFTNYIFAASLFFIAGIVLALVKERVLPPRAGRRWRRCVYGHWAARGEYCPEPGCGLYLAPVPEAQQKRIEYVASHQIVKRTMGHTAMRYHFALWLTTTEMQDGREYGLDIAVMMYKSSWRLRAEQVVAEEMSDSDTD